jgi:hypothetical protein
MKYICISDLLEATDQKCNPSLLNQWRASKNIKTLNIGHHKYFTIEQAKQFAEYLKNIPSTKIKIETVSAYEFKKMLEVKK